MGLLHSFAAEKTNDVAVSDNIVVRILTTIEEIDAVRNDWESLQGHPNSDFSYYRSMLGWYENGATPCVITVSKAGRIRTILAGRAEECRLPIKFGYRTLVSPRIKCLSLIYGGLLGDLSDSCLMALGKELVGILKRGRIDTIFVNHVGMESSLDHCLRSSILCWLIRDLFPQANLHWRMELPTTLEQVYQRLSSKRRHELRRRERQFLKEYGETVRVKSFASLEDTATIMQDAERVAQTTYQRGMGVGFISNDFTRKRLNWIAEKGWLRAHFLYVEGEPWAFWIGTLYGQKMYLDYTGYDTRHRLHQPGVFLFLKMIEDLCLTKVQEVDFGFGDASYKQRFGTVNQTEKAIYLFAATPKGILLSVLRNVVESLSMITRMALNTSGKVGFVKRLWRRRLVKMKMSLQSNYEQED